MKKGSFLHICLLFLCLCLRFYLFFSLLLLLSRSLLLFTIVSSLSLSLLQYLFGQDAWFVKRTHSIQMLAIQFQMVSWQLIVSSNCIAMPYNSRSHFLTCVFFIPFFLSFDRMHNCTVTCFQNGTEVQKSTVTCEVKNGCRLIQKTGQCCPEYQCGTYVEMSKKCDDIPTFSTSPMSHSIIFTRTNCNILSLSFISSKTDLSCE